jgi:hypothetical protein
VLVAQRFDCRAEADRTHIGCVRIARDQMREPAIEQRSRAPRRPRSEASVDGSRRQLHQCPAGDQRLEQVGLLLHVRVPLGMREHHVEALDAEAKEPLAEVERPTEVRRLHEQPRRASQPEPRELLLRTVELRQIELAARDDSHGRARCVEGGERVLHLAGRGRVVVANVRRRREHLDTVGSRRCAQRERLVDRPDAVVDAGQDMRVEIDQRAANARYNSRAAAVPSST